MKTPELRIPEVVRLQAREAQQSARVWTMRSQETGLQGQVQNLHQGNARINDLMNHIQITSDSMDIRDKVLAQQLRTSNLELSPLQTKVSHLRTSVVRNQSTQMGNAKIFKN